MGTYADVEFGAETWTGGGEAPGAEIEGHDGYGADEGGEDPTGHLVLRWGGSGEEREEKREDGTTTTCTAQARQEAGHDATANQSRCRSTRVGGGSESERRGRCDCIDHTDRPIPIPSDSFLQTTMTDPRASRHWLPPPTLDLPTTLAFPPPPTTLTGRADDDEAAERCFRFGTHDVLERESRRYPAWQVRAWQMPRRQVAFETPLDLLHCPFPFPCQMGWRGKGGEGRTVWPQVPQLAISDARSTHDDTEDEDEDEDETGQEVLPDGQAVGSEGGEQTSLVPSKVVEWPTRAWEARQAWKQ